jgi:hypothetical protein
MMTLLDGLDSVVKAVLVGRSLFLDKTITNGPAERILP